jgi:hypothetical protein
VAERRGYKNGPEDTFARAAREAGWFVTKRGWPDFFCVREDTGEVMLVEVKPGAGSSLKLSQQRIYDALRAAGVNVRLWSPERGFHDDEP